MSDEVLSGEEIDALMDSVSAGDVPLEQAEGDCQHFDFSSRTQMLLVQMPALRTVADKHALEILQSLEGHFRIPVRVTARDTALMPMGEALLSIPEPSAITLVSHKTLGHNSVLAISGELLSFFVDQYFGGGSAGSTPQATSETSLTPTEQRINSVFVEYFLQTQSVAWSEYTQIEGDAITSETNPDFLATGSPDQMVIAFHYDIGQGEWQSSITWLVPYAAIEPIRSRLNKALLEDESKFVKNWEPHLRAEMADIALNMHGVLATADMGISRLMGLKAGDILPLKMGEFATLCAENTPIAIGEHGTLNGSKSIKITAVGAR